VIVDGKYECLGKERQRKRGKEARDQVWIEESVGYGSRGKGLGK